MQFNKKEKEALKNIARYPKNIAKHLKNFLKRLKITEISIWLRLFI